MKCGWTRFDLVGVVGSYAKIVSVGFFTRYRGILAALK